MNSHNGAAGTSSEETELISPANLRKLILNYLVHHCYADTAQVFARDAISDSLSIPSTSTKSNKPSAVPSNGASSSNHAAESASGNGHSHFASTRQAHPLSAPPLSRNDSSMEVEVDSLLTSFNADYASSQPRVLDDDESMMDAPAETNGHSNGVHNGSSTANVNGHADDTSLHAAQGDLTAKDIEAVKIRKEIRDHIINGRIRLAIDMCNSHFPAVLDASTASYSTRPRKGPYSTDAPIITSSASSSERVLPANPTSLDPSHLLLNLQIQVFIESIRSAATSQLTGSLSSLAQGTSLQLGSSSHLPSLATNTPGIAAASISRATSPAPSSSSSNGSGTSTNGGGPASALNPALTSALAYAQGLYTSAQKLPSYWRAMYLKELEQVTALLAYTDVEHSPVRKFLHRSRKVALAEQVNSAILYRTGKPSQPLIESAVRQTAFVCTTLHKEKVPIPATHSILSVTGAPITPFEESTSKKNGGGGKILPEWDFGTFLSER